MGMESVFRLSVVMDMVDRLTSPLQQTTNQTEQATQRIADALNKTQKAGAVMAGVGAGITTACLATVTATFDTQDALGELSSLGVTDLKAVEAAAKSFSDTWAGTTKDAFITAAYDIKSGIASLTDEGVAQFTELAALTGKATKSTTEEMGSLFATGYGIYKGAYEDMSDLDFGAMFSAGIATAVKNYKTAGSEMASAISALGATATNNNVSLEEQLSILGQLQTTMSGSEAATKYRAFLNAAASAGDKLGVSFTDANNQLLSTPEILKKLQEKYGSTIDAIEKQQLKAAFGTDEAVAMIDLLYTDIDGLSSGIDSMAASMKKGTAVTEEMAAAINSTPAQKFEVIKQQIHNNVEELGNGLLPVINETLDKTSGLIQCFSGWIGRNQETAHTIMNIALKLGVFLIIAGSVLGVVGKFGNALLGAKNAINLVKSAFSKLNLAFLSSPITWVIVAIVALIAIFAVLWNKSESFRNFWINLFEKVRGAVAEAWTALQPVFAQLWQGLQNLFEALQEAWEALQPVFTQLWQSFQELFDALKPVFDALQEAWTALQPVFAQLWQSLQELYEQSKPIMDVILQIAGVIGTVLLGSAVGAIQGIINALAPLVRAFTSLVSFVTNVINAIVALFKGDFGGACDFLSAAVEDLKNFFINGFDAILSFISGFADGFLNVVGGVLDAVGIDASGTIEKVKSTVSNGLEAVRGFFGNIMGAAADTAKEKLDNIKATYEEHGGGIQGAAAAALEGVKGIYTSGLTFVDNLTGGKLTDIKQKFTDGLLNVKNTVTGTLDDIKSAFQEKLDAAHAVVTGIVDKIKGVFNFEWSLPALKLPHISVTGGEAPYGIAGKGSLPQFSIDWYAKGGVMTKPTIFGAAGGKLLGGGEAGDEAILPLSALWEKLGSFLGALFEDEDKKSASKKSAVVSVLSKETRDAKRQGQTEKKEKTVRSSQASKENKGISIQRLDIHVDIKKIKDLEYLANLIDELKDAQMQEDFETT